MIQIILNLPESMRLELSIHACAVDMTIQQMLEHCATQLVASGRPAGWEELSPSEEGQAIRAANIQSKSA